MNTHVAFTVQVLKSELADGSVVFSAFLEEKPGVVVEGESEQAAVSELLALVENLRERIWSDFIGIRTNAIKAWTWTIQTEAEKPISFSSEETHSVSGGGRPRAVA